MAKKDIEGFPIPFGIKSPNKMYRADSYAGPYDSIQDAMDTIEPSIREVGRHVGIYKDSLKKSVDRYYFEKDETDEWILVKSSSGTPQAPEDSQAYGIKDGQWVTVVETEIDKGLSQANFELLEKQKLGTIEEGAQKNDPNTTLKGNTFNGGNQLVELLPDGSFPAINANKLINIDYNNLINQPDLSVFNNLEVHPTFSDFPVVGDINKLYLEQEFNGLYRWNGTDYTEVTGNLAIGTTSTTAGRGDWNLIAYNHSQSPHAPINAEPNNPNTTIKGNDFNGANQLVELLPDGSLPIISGKNLTELDIIYDGASPTTIAVGGVSENTNIYGKSIKKIIQDILTPFQLPKFTSFSIQGVSTNVEMGATISGIKNFLFAFTNNGNVKNNSIKITDETAGTTLLENAPKISPQSSDVGNISKSTLSQHTWKIEGENTQGNKFSTTMDVNWKYPYFFGGSQIDINSTLQVRGLNQQGLDLGGTFMKDIIANNSNTNFYLFIHNSRKITYISDESALSADITSSYVLVGTIIIQDLNGNDQTYKKYKFSLSGKYSTPHTHNITIKND